MSVEAIVIPQGLPQVGSTINTELITAVAKPRVIVPTDSINIGSGETMQIDGTLIVNGSLIGSGLPQPNTPSTAINNLTDVSLGTLDLNHVLKWDGSRWTNKEDASGLDSVGVSGLTDVDLNSLSIGDVLKWDGSRWKNEDDASGGSRLNTLVDVDVSGLKDGSTLQYNSNNFKWEIVDETDFVDAIIDGGSSGADSLYVDAFDIDGGNA